MLIILSQLELFSYKILVCCGHIYFYFFYLSFFFYRRVFILLMLRYDASLIACALGQQLRIYNIHSLMYKFMSRRFNMFARCVVPLSRAIINNLVFTIFIFLCISLCLANLICLCRVWFSYRKRLLVTSYLQYSSFYV